MANSLHIIFLLIGKYKELMKYFSYCTLHCEIATTYIRKAVPDRNSQQWSTWKQQSNA